MLLPRGFHPTPLLPGIRWEAGEHPSARLPWPPSSASAWGSCPSPSPRWVEQPVSSTAPLTPNSCLQEAIKQETGGTEHRFWLRFPSLWARFPALCLSFLLSSPQGADLCCHSQSALVRTWPHPRHSPAPAKVQVFPHSATSSHPKFFHLAFVLPLPAGTSNGFFPKVWRTCTLPGWDLDR